MMTERREKASFGSALGLPFRKLHHRAIADDKGIHRAIDWYRLIFSVPEKSLYSAFYSIVLWSSRLRMHIFLSTWDSALFTNQTLWEMATVKK